MSKTDKLRALVERWRVNARSPFANEYLDGRVGARNDCADELAAILAEPEEAEPVAHVSGVFINEFGSVVLCQHGAEKEWVAERGGKLLYTAPPDVEPLRAENARLAAKLAGARDDAAATVKAAVMRIPSWKIDGRWISAQFICSVIDAARGESK